MATYPARAVVLQRTKLGESDLILTMLSSDGGIIRAVAKGARKPKSKLGAASGLFRCNDWLLHTGRNLDVVSEARTVASHAHLAGEYRAALGASVIAEFTVKTNLPGQFDSRVYDMTLVALGVLDRCAEGWMDVDESGGGTDDYDVESDHSTERSVDAVVLAYLIKSLAMHGYRPSGLSCAECGQPLGAGEDVRWSALVAGALCHDCAPTAVDATSLPYAAASWVEFMLRSTLSDVAETPISDPAVDDLFRVVTGLLDAHVQTRIRALEVYRAERDQWRRKSVAPDPPADPHAVD